MKINLMENVYGIKSIKEQIFQKNCTLIYASNGMMKSSFTKGIKEITSGKRPFEIVFNRKPNYSIEINGINHDSNKLPIEQKNVICFNNDYYENISSIENIPVLLVNDKLSDKFNNVKKEQRKNSDEIFKILKTIFKVRDESKIYSYLSKIYDKNLIHATGEILKLFKNTKIENHFLNKETTNEILELILDSRTDGLKKSVEINELIDLVITEKNGLYVDKNFTLSELESLQKTLSKEAKHFFNKKNFLTLNSNIGEQKKITSLEQLNNLIENENNLIYDSKEFKDKLEKLKKISQANTQTKKLFLAISNNQRWIIEYLKQEHFLKNYFESILFQNVSILNKYIKENDKWMKEIESINIEVKENFDKTKWNKILIEFNNRMKLPFQIDIENKFNATMNGDTPKIIFKYFDNLENKKIFKNDEEVLSYISSGEKKTLVFLSLLYKINVLIEQKENESGIILILDDIVESFDYQNKYAILNYLLEFISSDHYGQNNKLIILSHNFDFIRTCQYHFRTGSQSFLVEKDNNGDLSFKDFFDSEFISTNRDSAISIFTKWIDIVNSKNCNYDDQEKLNSLVSLLPVMRNINELKNKKSDFNLLSKILHFHKEIDIKGIKKNSEDVLWKDLLEEFSIFEIKSIEDSIIENKTIHETVLSCCEKIISNNDKGKSIYNNLKEKIILAYGVRIKLEKMMVDLLTKNNFLFKWDKNYKTADFHLALIKIDINSKGAYNPNLRKKVNKALTLTNEVIHLNSFMYEPLIDLDIKDLKTLYSESKTIY